jgi:hypothetical protein
MYSRFVPPLLCAAAIAFACRPGVRTSIAAAAPHHRQADESAGVAGTLGVTTADGVRFAFQVVNGSDERIEVRFRSGLTRDFVVLDDHEREVWRWSSGRMFTQSVQNTVLPAGDSVAFEERWTPAKPGRYTVVARLNSANFPVEQRASFDVPQVPAGQVAVHQ